MKRIVLTTLAGLTAFALVTGLAASLTVNGSDLGSGTAVVAACDADGVDVSFGLLTGDITSVTEVTVAGVDAACDTQTMYVELVDSLGNVLASETTTVGATGSETLSLTSTVAAASITDVNVTITG